MINDLDYLIVCLYQLEDHKIDLTTKTHGDCRNCIADYKNKLCDGYYPIKLYSIKVIKNES